MVLKALLVACLLHNGAALATYGQHSFQYKEVKAARRQVDLTRRSDSISTRTSLMLAYAEDSLSVHDSSAYISNVHLETDHPTLLIEEFDHLLDLVECTDTTMLLKFRQGKHVAAAKEACGKFEEGLVVVSHASCSDAGAHEVLSVSAVEYNVDEAEVLLHVEVASWKQAFSSPKIEFGRTSKPHKVHDHGRLARRQATPTDGSDVTAIAQSIVPTASATAESTTFDLSKEFLDTTFSWPLGVGPKIPLEVGCKNCTTKGEVVLTQGEIELLDFSEITSSLFNDDLDFVKTGFFQLEVNGFEASILLRALPSVSLEFAYDLFSLPVAGIRIPKFGSAGVLITPQIVFGIEISGGVELTFGFDVKVPDKSTIRLDIGTLNNSKITGFDQSTVTTLPFNANASDITLTMTSSLRTFIAMGMSFYDGDVKLLGGPFLDLPSVGSTITQLATSGANENCETGKGLTSAKFQDAFKNLTHIENSLGMGIGFEFEADISLFPNAVVDHTIWNLTTDLPTACLAFQGGTMTAAVAALEKVNAAKGMRAGPGPFPSFPAIVSHSAVAALFALAAVVVAL